MVNDVRFVTSEEDLASEQRPGLTTQGSGVAEVLLMVNKFIFYLSYPILDF